jgi:hypothetical protein
MFDHAYKRAVDLAAVFEANPFAAAHVCVREVQLATSLPILHATPEHRSFILAMSSWAGALHACRCAFWEIVEPLVRGACQMAAETRGLWRLSPNFMMFLLQVVPALKEPTADRVAAIAATISIKTELHGDEETHWHTFLAECAAGNVPAYLYTPAKQRCDFLCSSHAFLKPTFCLISLAQFVRGTCVVSHSFSHLKKVEHQGFLHWRGGAGARGVASRACRNAIVGCVRFSAAPSPSFLNSPPFFVVFCMWSQSASLSYTPLTCSVGRHHVGISLSFFALV